MRFIIVDFDSSEVEVVGKGGNFKDYYKEIKKDYDEDGWECVYVEKDDGDEIVGYEDDRVEFIYKEIK